MSYLPPPIRDSQLLELALTHRSYVNEHPTETHNERLEFLGDAVLGFLVGELLYARYPQMSEAQLTRTRSALVDETQLGQLGREMGIGAIVRLGRGAELDGGRESPAILSDTFEALIAAYFLEAGIEAVRDYVGDVFTALVEQRMHSQSSGSLQSFIDSKNLFQQWVHAHFPDSYKPNPEYIIVKQTGPDHAKEFVAQVRVNDRVYGRGKGRRKQEAEKKAAEDALKQLGLL
ncbi:ribonuclease III [Oscillatoriales cyanobacterium LEGE 11467]|uniref:Ribonuclease 3 n=1 Tax=Zarconia navalis LEGE 11467 TaxID=1828826 RepID=A0A928W0X4_9CYAN|nr:ribonuclease III [Zarconia navalis]MBE9041250.1 ribonuclease III [Zarconia navalis LEGE 11467]